MKKHWIQWGIPVAVVLAAAIGGPFLINKCYKLDGGYITMWKAADMLSYYGGIVAACIGIIGVFLTVYIANRNYRDDARNRILPYIAVDVLDNRQPDVFLESFGSENYSSMGNNPIIEDSLTGKNHNHLFFIIDGQNKDRTVKIRVTESLTDDEATKMKRTEVKWRRATDDGKMYLRGSDRVSMPFLVENIGNGPARRLRMSFFRPKGKQFCKTELLLKQNEAIYIHIFSEKSFEEINGDYVFAVYYEDICCNEYEQLFPIDIIEKNGSRYNRIDTSGAQRLIGRAK